MTMLRGTPRTRKGLLGLATLALVGASASAGAAPGRPGEPKSGLSIAQKLCSGCHMVAPGSNSTAQPGIPSFPAIAGHEGQTAERLAGIIIVPHPPMPTIQLTMTEIRDVVAYIMSLKSDK